MGKERIKGKLRVCFRKEIRISARKVGKAKPRILPGSTVGCVKRITFLIRKLSLSLIGFFLSVFWVVGVCASEVSWVNTKDGQVIVRAQNGNEYVLSVPVGVKGVYFDGDLHRVDEKEYLSIFQVSASNPERPDGSCGSGDEVWLQLYESLSKVSSRILVSSCLHSISLASQNSGQEGQDNDYSSVKWDDYGFSIEWFGRVDSFGRVVSLTRYRLCGDSFCASDLFQKKSGN